MVEVAQGLSPGKRHLQAPGLCIKAFGIGARDAFAWPQAAGASVKRGQSSLRTEPRTRCPEWNRPRTVLDGLSEIKPCRHCCSNHLRLVHPRHFTFLCLGPNRDLDWRFLPLPPAVA